MTSDEAKRAVQQFEQETNASLANAAGEPDLLAIIDRAFDQAMALARKHDRMRMIWKYVRAGGSYYDEESNTRFADVTAFLDYFLQ